MHRKGKEGPGESKRLAYVDGKLKHWHSMSTTNFETSLRHGIQFAMCALSMLIHNRLITPCQGPPLPPGGAAAQHVPWPLHS